MPYLGNVPAEAYTNTVKDSFNGDGSTTAFTLSQPSTTNNLRVVVENVIQDPTVAYTVSGTTLTFTSAPPVGTANIYAVHLGPATMTAVPPSEINNATTYTSDLTVQGAFTSQGIDDNATSTAITLDSSNNLLVGTTSSDPASPGENVTGIAIGAIGYISMTRDGAVPAFFNRKTSDGDIAQFRKDGTTVGSIGSRSSGSALQIYTSSTGIDFGGDGILPMAGSTITDNSRDIGSSSFRFKDFYISGDIAHKDAADNARLLYDKSANLLGNAGTYLYGAGVYLGGTGSANLLDDYEEGTWTPTANQGCTGFTVKSAHYVKIGRSVTLEVYLTLFTGKNSSQLRIGGLPFTPLTNHYSTGVIDGSETGHCGFVRTNSTNTYLPCFYVDETDSNRLSLEGNHVGSHIIFSITYQTS